MSQVTLEFSNPADFALLLSVAKRLNAHIVSIQSDAPLPSEENRWAILQQAANDPLFLADIAEVADDFKYVDEESL